jgi:osmotically-inducible protein OsmY
MMNSKAEDKMLAKLARNAMARSILDISELNVTCADGHVELTGKVRAARGHKGDINFKKEMEALKQHIRTVRGIKDVYDNRVAFVE